MPPPFLIKYLDKAVKFIFSDPAIGDTKAGDLQGIQVYKYKPKNQHVLSAYEVVKSTLFLYTFGF